MLPHYIFRIDEITENPASPESFTRNGYWMPSLRTHANYRTNSGVSGHHHYCDGQQIRSIGTQLPPGSRHYSTFSVYYSAGCGFWVLRGDGVSPQNGDVWLPLRFDHDEGSPSSYLTNAGTAHTLRYQRTDQRWPHMLLPDIYHAYPKDTSRYHGGLTGDLPIFLALIAFSMATENLPRYLLRMFFNSRWVVHELNNGRCHKRGVVVNVWTCPQWASNSNNFELSRYEKGEYGYYYN